jgi:Cell wall hydrolyses involved in spore germination
MKCFQRVKTLIITTGLTIGLSLSIPMGVSATTYQVVKGDTLYALSQTFHTTVSTLINDNSLATTNLNIGQNLTVHTQTYAVQKGDTLFSISQKFKISLTTLRRANNKYNDYLDIGQVLCIPYSESDVDLLSRLISAEAIGESYEAKVAVGAAVINRVESPLWPNTLTGVIYQYIGGYYQFTPVANGYINKTADVDSIKAAREAISGVDTIDGATFYYDNTSTNAWILSKPVAARIDNMVFAY